MPSTNMASDWRNRPRAVNTRVPAPIPVLLCADPDGLSGATDYAAVLRGLGGFAVWSLDLFDDHIMHATLPADFEPARDLVVVPSTRAVTALQAQTWFDASRRDLRAIAPGPETARALADIGVPVLWTAERGFRQSRWPAALEGARRLYVANAALDPSALSLVPGPTDWHLPLYRRMPRAGAPWTPMQARALCQSQTVVALALSGSQRQILEARLSLLGRRLPPSRKLIALSPTVAGWSPAVPRRSFWHRVTFPALPNRASMLHHLQNLAV